MAVASSRQMRGFIYDNSALRPHFDLGLVCNLVAGRYGSSTHNIVRSELWFTTVLYTVQWRNLNPIHMLLVLSSNMFPVCRSTFLLYESGNWISPWPRQNSDEYTLHVILPHPIPRLERVLAKYNTPHSLWHEPCCGNKDILKSAI